jgi:hypothetical protein
LTAQWLQATVLNLKRQFRRGRSFVHDPIVFLLRHRPQDLTNRLFSGKGDDAG